MPHIPAHEGASTGDGRLTGWGAAPAACPERGSGGCALPSRPHPTGEDDGPNAPGSLDQVRPPPLRAVATGWLKGGASSRRARARRLTRTGTGKVHRAPAVPRTGSAEVEVEKRRGGRFDERRH